MLTYKGYHAVTEYREDDRIIFGQVLNLTDTIVFEARSADEVEPAFHGAVDDYLDFCERLGKKPEKAYSGRFNVRIEPDVHRDAALLARASGGSLNDMVKEALKREVNRRKRKLA